MMQWQAHRAGNCECSWLVAAPAVTYFRGSQWVPSCNGGELR
jgi:hypothetical protein